MELNNTKKKATKEEAEFFFHFHSKRLVLSLHLKTNNHIFRETYEPVILFVVQMTISFKKKQNKKETKKQTKKHPSNKGRKVFLFHCGLGFDHRLSKLYYNVLAKLLR